MTPEVAGTPEGRMDMQTRTASCCCGDFTITVSGEPHYVHRCHCDYCQKRTGNVFQVSCWYPEDQIVSRRGDFQVFKAYPNLEASYSQSNMETPPNPGISYKFCKRCGSTVYWDIPLAPGVFGPSETVVTGIAVGCFFDPDFPKPVEDHYASDRHHWVPLLEGVDSYDGMPPAQSSLTGEPLTN